MRVPSLWPLPVQRVARARRCESELERDILAKCAALGNEISHGRVKFRLPQRPCLEFIEKTNISHKAHVLYTAAAQQFVKKNNTNI